MTEARIDPQTYMDSLRERVEERSHLYGDKPWAAHIGEGIFRCGGAEVGEITDFIRKRYGTPGSEQGVEEGEGHAALYMLVKLHLMEAGIVDMNNARISRP